MCPHNLIMATYRWSYVSKVALQAHNCVGTCAPCGQPPTHTKPVIVWPYWLCVPRVPTRTSHHTHVCHCVVVLVVCASRANTHVTPHTRVSLCGRTCCVCLAYQCARHTTHTCVIVWSYLLCVPRVPMRTSHHTHVCHCVVVLAVCASSVDLMAGQSRPCT